MKTKKSNIVFKRKKPDEKFHYFLACYKSYDWYVMKTFEIYSFYIKTRKPHISHTDISSCIKEWEKENDHKDGQPLSVSQIGFMTSAEFGDTGDIEVFVR